MNNETQILKDMKEWVMHGFGLMKLRPYCEFLDAVLANDQWLPVYEKYQTTFADSTKKCGQRDMSTGSETRTQ